MLGYYSYDPPPCYEDAVDIIKSRYLKNLKNYHDLEFYKDINLLINNNLKEWEEVCVRKAFIDNNLLNNDNTLKLLSLAAWISLGVDTLIKSVINNTETYYLHKFNKNNRIEKII